ncbi:universal stress protein [Nitrosopumilus sp. b1]|nr:universal stress protein [Nitrosopumilus sp. b1]
MYLARQCQATITGLYVTPIQEPKKNDQISYVERYLLKHASQFMQKSKKRAGENGILFEDKVLYGDEGKKIVDYAKKGKFDLIVIGSRGVGTVKGFFLGSTSNYVLHKSSVPVLIVK